MTRTASWKNWEKMFCPNPIGELPHLKSYRLEGGALLYICADQQSGQWFIKAIDNHRLGSGTRLKATSARNLLKPIKVALRVRDKVAQTQDELLRWTLNLNPGLHTENWRVLGRQSETKCQRLFLHIDRDSLVIIQKIGNKIFTGLSQGIVTADSRRDGRYCSHPRTLGIKGAGKGLN
jgi:hypothetical protein